MEHGKEGNRVIQARVTAPTKPLFICPHVLPLDTEICRAVLPGGKSLAINLVKVRLYNGSQMGYHQIQGSN